MTAGLDVHLIELSDSFFRDAQAISPLHCHDPAWRLAVKRQLEVRAKDATPPSPTASIPRWMDRLCGPSADAYVLGLATDKAVQALLSRCRTCSHVLIADAGGLYRPDFLALTLKQDRDIAIMDHDDSAGSRVSAALLPGQVDVSAALLRREVFRNGARGFLNSLPSHPDPLDLVDLDLYLIEKATRLYGASLGFIHDKGYLRG